MTENVEIGVAKLEKEAILPTLKYEGDAGIDFYCLYDIIIPSFKYKVVQTGITVSIPKEYHGILKAKGINNHIVGAGVVENTYQGEILFKIFNPTDEQRVFKKGTAIGQMILVPAVSPIPLEIDKKEIHKDKTTRQGTGGIVEHRES